MERTSEFQALDLALKTTNENLISAQSTAKAVLKAFDDSQKAISDASAAATNANSGADTANQAAGSAASAVETAANNAVHACNDAVTNMAATAQAEVNKHASRTDNPHIVTAAQIGAATTAISVQNLTLMSSLQITGNQICRALKINLLKFVTAELTCTTAISAWTQILSLPQSNCSYGFPAVIWVNNVSTLAWLYPDGTFKTCATIAEGAKVVVNLMYV